MTKKYVFSFFLFWKRAYFSQKNINMRKWIFERYLQEVFPVVYHPHLYTPSGKIQFAHLAIIID